MVILQKFSKYDCMQVLIDDSRWLKAEKFRDRPSVDSGVSNEVSAEDWRRLCLSGLVCD